MNIIINHIKHNYYFKVLVILMLGFFLGCKPANQVGPLFSESSNCFGTYGDGNFYIILGDINTLESDLSGIDKNFINKAKNGNWDGYSFIYKGRGTTGIGLWNIVGFDGTQVHEYPKMSQGKKFNGMEIKIIWERSYYDWEIYPDGVYQIRNDPNGNRWYDESKPKESYIKYLFTPSGNPSFPLMR